MADAIASGPAFLAGLRGLSPDARKGLLETTHAEYARRVEGWRVLLDAFDGAGGFLDGSYLWAYPSEGANEFSSRKDQARYHNHIESIVDIYVRHVFAQGVQRTTTSDEYLAWTDDVDGHGTTLTDILKRAAAVSLVSGHCGILIDKTPEAPMGPTRADDRGRVVPALFTAPTIVDWRYDVDRLSAIKLQEAAPPTSILSTPTTDYAWLLWDGTGWARFDSDGEVLRFGAPDMGGTVPLVVVRPKPAYTARMVGRPLVGHSKIVQAVFNRTSEEDEVLRTQAFSVLTVSVPPEGNVSETREQLGAVIGTSKALVLKGTIDYKTPDQSVPGAIRDNVGFLIRELFRSAHVRVPKDSAQVETAEAIKLQNAELNEMLIGLASAMAAAERDICRLWHLWMEPSPDVAASRFEAANFEAIYPTEFFLEDIMIELQEIAEGIGLGLGPTMSTRLKLRAAKRLDPTLSDEDLQTVEGEIAEAVAAGERLMDQGIEEGDEDQDMPPTDEDA